MLPAFGIYSEVVATFSGKRLFGYTSLVLTTAAIGILSMAVWLHHFFTMGSSASVNTFFGIATTVIAVPCPHAVAARLRRRWTEMLQHHGGAAVLITRLHAILVRSRAGI